MKISAEKVDDKGGEACYHTHTEGSFGDILNVCACILGDRLAVAAHKRDEVIPPEEIIWVFTDLLARIEAQYNQTRKKLAEEDDA